MSGIAMTNSHRNAVDSDELAAMRPTTGNTIMTPKLLN
jgi:hypothetical protein